MGGRYYRKVWLRRRVNENIWLQERCFRGRKLSWVFWISEGLGMREDFKETDAGGWMCREKMQENLRQEIGCS